MSYLSEFSVVFHENCTIGKLTLSSIQPHKATLSTRPSLSRRALSKSLIQSPPISPPFVSYLSEFLIVFHGNCTVGQLTFSSIEPHKVTLSIPLRHLNWGECCQKVTFDLLQFHSFPCQISVSYQLFFMKLHSWKVHIFLYSTTQSSYPTGHLYFWDHCEKVISCWFLQRSRLDHLIPPHLITTLFPADTIRGADKTTVSLLSWNPLTFHIADTIRGAG